MNYLETETLIRVGDHVRYAGEPGVIVYVIDDDKYSASYPKEHWSYLQHGFGVELQNGTLYQFEEPDEDLEYVRSP